MIYLDEKRIAIKHIALGLLAVGFAATLVCGTALSVLLILLMLLNY